ncbi:MAG: class I SAM-dependent methyltransferase [Pseudomonadota bacterium]
MRERWRRLMMGAATLLGRPRGFFSPYRYAATVGLPAGYPALETAFAGAFAAEATGGMLTSADVLAAIGARAGALAALDGPAPRPRWGQSWYPRLDGAAAYAIVAAARPRRIVEVGSGHSTRFMAEAVRAEGLSTTITCIDPAPRAALLDLPVTWERRVLGQADLARFEALEVGDIAFFDSSHLLWPGTDVDLILNAILPVLRPGVLIHLHDVFLPDPYPASWAWRGYTEQLGLSGWLLGGGASILWASHYARTRAGAADHLSIAPLPLPAEAPESALWLIRR